ncbi:MULTISPECIES: TetR/AcrR family transcriptional regulator [Rhodococcus]|uniref:TetR/AcrR family transcriptional regulator n=1 Tax=Rhodococcus pseudokoreensis TaxID=2811421 RepID=A0A974ZTM8_9NOCA|nr:MULTISPECIES: TetR/AcrR family transcriptional regulator [Rhodococcus]MBV6760726.1 TetR/AcrR family transcriptional regulator [Rhodococcus opacus]QSE89859.1 TetR/AcrR family transcriptional regulator [Rhodococcus pseudokoreensis]
MNSRNGQAGRAPGSRRKRLPAAERRVEILTRSARLFYQRGYTGVSVDDIGADIGISGPALYRHFAGKEAILLAIGVGVLDDLVSIVDATLADAAELSARQRLDRTIGPVVEYCLGHRAELAVALRHVRNLNPDRRAEITRRRDELGDRLVPILLDVHPQLGIADAELYVRASAGGVIGLARVGHRNIPRARLVELATGLVSAVLSVSLAPGAEGPVAHTIGWVRSSRREQILHTAIGLFRERGFRGVSMVDIAEAVGVTAAAPYRHFKNKEDILATALHRAGERVTLGMDAALAGADSADSAMNRLLRSYIDVMLEIPDLIVVAAAEQHHLGPDAQAERQRKQQVFIEEWTHCLTTTRPDLSPSDGAAMVSAIAGMLNEVMLSETLAARPGISDELFQLCHAALYPTVDDEAIGETVGQ